MNKNNSTQSSISNKMLHKLMHDLKNSLNSIIGFSDIILSKTHGEIKNSKYQEYITDINNSVLNMLSIIENSTFLLKATNGELKTQISEIEINKLTKILIEDKKQSINEIEFSGKEFNNQLIKTDINILSKLFETLFSIISNIIPIKYKIFIDINYTNNKNNNSLGNLNFIIQIKPIFNNQIDENIQSIINNKIFLHLKKLEIASYNKNFDPENLEIALSRYLLELLEINISIEQKEQIFLHINLKDNHSAN